jgi:predicted nucleic acid-binding Zn ribbon protein
MKNTLIRHCLLCQNVLFGRSDKKFCDDHCRNAFHNEQTRITSVQVRAINKILQRNRRILIQFRANLSNQVSKQELHSAGFNFDYFTHIKPLKGGKSQIFCYEQGYLPIENDYFALVIQQD